MAGAPFLSAVVAILLLPTPALAYVGPGAGFAFVNAAGDAHADRAAAVRAEAARRFGGRSR